MANNNKLLINNNKIEVNYEDAPVSTAIGTGQRIETINYNKPEEEKNRNNGKRRLGMGLNFLIK